MSIMRHRAALGAIGALAAAALALAGCTEGGQTNGTPQAGKGSGAASATAAAIDIKAEPIQTDAALGQADPTVSYAGMAYSPDGSGVLAGYRSDGLGQKAAAFWKGTKGKWSEAANPGVPEGNVVALQLSDGMVSGTVLDAQGKPTNFILRSQDMETWTAIDVPEEANGYRLTAQTWGDENMAYLLGEDGDQRAVLLAQTESGITVQPLPEPEEDHWRQYRTLAAHGKTIVVGYYDGANDEQAGSLAFVSADGGATWESVTVTKDTQSEYSSSTYADGQFVIAGHGAKTGDEDFSVPMMWVAKDGRAWTAIAGPKVSDDDVRGPNDAYSTSFMGRSLGAQEAVVGSDDSPGLSIFVRSAKGAWSKKGPTLESSATDSWAMPMRLERGLGMVTSGNGELAIWRCTDNATWVKAFAAGKTSAAPWVEHVFGGIGTVTALGNSQMFRYGSDGSWSRSFDAATLEVDGDTLTAATWRGADLDQAAYPTMATDADTGQQVLVVRTEDDGHKMTIKSWTRASEKDTWTAGTPFAVPGWSYPGAVSWDGSRWVMEYVESVAVGEKSARVTFATSMDGKVWKKLDSKAKPTSSGALVGGLCPLGDGKLLAAGTADSRPAGKLAAVAWILAGDTVTPVAADALARTGSTGFTSCAAGPKGVVLTDRLGHALYVTADGATFEKAATFDLSSTAPSVTAVPGGYAVGGNTNTDTVTAPTIWLSKDAKNWSPGAMPNAVDADANVAVASDGTDLVAVTVNSWPVQAWRVSDIAGLLK